MDKTTQYKAKLINENFYMESISKAMRVQVRSWIQNRKKKKSML